MLLQFQVGELAEFLKYGISGLSAIAFILSFFLLNRESSRPKPRPEMLRSIRMFMGLTLILGLVSGVAVIMNGEPNPPKKATSPPKKASLVSKITTPRQVWEVEVFYDKGAQGLAEQVADELTAFKDYDVKVTLLDAKRKKELRVISSQIRHELAEKQAAAQLQKRIVKILPQDVTLNLKQITSSSPDYLSVFVCD
ncbi:MAG: hypothetical protein MUE30_11765 [Spirosomaceae bacterium]|nr:hypothetical protein [Spirosomataceae bacterium]